MGRKKNPNKIKTVQVGLFDDPPVEGSPDLESVTGTKSASVVLQDQNRRKLNYKAPQSNRQSSTEKEAKSTRRCLEIRCPICGDPLWVPRKSDRNIGS